MKTRYIIQMVDWRKITTLESYEKALQESEQHIVYGLQEVFNFCGGKVKRERGGYQGFNNMIEYIITRADKPKRKIKKTPIYINL